MRPDLQELTGGPEEEREYNKAGGNNVDYECPHYAIGEHIYYIFA